MLTTKQISEIMNCGLWMARRRMESAGIKCDMKAFGHGRKAYWNITEEQVLAIMAEEERDSGEIALQQTSALGALEAVFNQRRMAASGDHQ